jgi:hypothetical protein
MDTGRSTGAQQPGGLRERNVSRPDSTGGRDALTATGEVEIKDGTGKDQKTFGRTPDGRGKLHSLPVAFYGIHHDTCDVFATYHHNISPQTLVKLPPLTGSVPIDSLHGAPDP